MQLTCPVCKSLLEQQGKNMRCGNNHSFDAARQGYWNLLLAHKKRSKDPGDNTEMVQARRQFLDGGHYQALSGQINQLALDEIKGTENARILDMGCGEGYYTDRLHQHLLANGQSVELTGLDISKHAVKAACARTKEIQWLVASGADTPVPDQSLDLQLVLFSRLMPEALAKPMKVGSSLIVAWPGADHLIELRKLIYSEIRESHFNPVDTLKEQFELSKQVTVNYQFSLNSSEQISTLLAMTPHGQRLKAEAQQKIIDQEQLDLTLDVNLGVFTRL
ncbi:putative RNA methyltransferase [Neptuniibacter sp. PT8_73]|uniref:putative RNA methyltransferase n=1 Tax=Neptuniibacter sp. PT8_73 TaxID=3398206 RepID=UPI0039F6469B